MAIAKILAILLLGYNPIASFQNFIDIKENKILFKSSQDKKMTRESGFAYSSSFTTAQGQNSYQQQTTAINVNSNALKSPHILSINTTNNAQINGKVTVNGVVIKQLQGSKISFNLSPYLAIGTKKIEISGTYKPASSSVKIEFLSPSTQVTQQTGGNGSLNQSLVITVR